MYKWLIFCALCLAITQCSVQNKKIQIEQCILEISIQDNQVSFEKDEVKFIIIRFTNTGNDTVEIPTWLSTGKENEIDAEIQFKIDQYNEYTGNFVTLPQSQIDHDYILYYREYEKLPPKESINLKQNIEILHDLKKPGNYRLEFNLSINGLSICGIKDNVFYFEVESY